ncbi:MAG: phosphoglucosamine mutase [Bacteroidota bacterium]
MTLITSISGIRGTIGGKPGEGLTPVDIVNFTSAYAGFIKAKTRNEKLRIVVGRDARISGPVVESLVTGTLNSMGIDVVLLGPATTPTVEIAVTRENADGGIILTASHNPAQWNALKLLNHKGEFLSASDGEQLMKRVETGNFSYADVYELGGIEEKSYHQVHINEVLGLDLVKPELISEAGFRVAIDCVNSVGGIIIPDLLYALGVKEVIELYTEPDGNFPHNPEPLPENLKDIADKIRETQADLGFVVDPDVDRLAIVNEDGTMFGEEYTLVAVADYILSHKPGNTASNLSSSRALKDITRKYGMEYYSSAVGEVNVVEAMKMHQCVIGGEGNGGVIFPEFHYGRDALVGIALFLSHLAEKKLRCSELKATYPQYVISKNKISLDEGMNVDLILSKLMEEFPNEKINTIDGVKIDFDEGWVHLRKSNTEPIIRIYAEHRTRKEAEQLAGTIQEIVGKLSNSIT